MLTRFNGWPCSSRAARWRLIAKSMSARSHRGRWQSSSLRTRLFRARFASASITSTLPCTTSRARVNRSMQMKRSDCPASYVTTSITSGLATFLISDCTNISNKSRSGWSRSAMRCTRLIAPAPRTKKWSRIKQSDIPTHKLVAEEHPNQRAKREVGSEWQLGRPDPFPKHERDETDERANERAAKETEQNRAPTEKRANRGEKFQIAAPHGFTGDLQRVRNA